MKRLFILCVLVFVFCLALPSCGNAEINTENTSVTTSETPLIENADWYPIFEEYSHQLKPDRSPRMAFEELKHITCGMSFIEMYKIAGPAQELWSSSPVHISSIHPKIYYVYHTVEGVTVKIHLFTYLDEDDKYQLDVGQIIYTYPDGHEEVLTRTNTQ